MFIFLLTTMKEKDRRQHLPGPLLPARVRGDALVRVFRRGLIGNLRRCNSLRKEESGRLVSSVLPRKPWPSWNGEVRLKISKSGAPQHPRLPACLGSGQ